MKEALAVCVTVFLLIALLCGVCIYFAHQKNKEEGVPATAWQEFKDLVKAEKSDVSRSMHDDRDLL